MPLASQYLVAYLEVVMSVIRGIKANGKISNNNDFNKEISTGTMVTGSDCESNHISKICKSRKTKNIRETDVLVAYPGLEPGTP